MPDIEVENGAEEDEDFEEEEDVATFQMELLKHAIGIYLEFYFILFHS